MGCYIFKLGSAAHKANALTSVHSFQKDAFYSYGLFFLDNFWFPISGFERFWEVQFIHLPTQIPHWLHRSRLGPCEHQGKEISMEYFKGDTTWETSPRKGAFSYYQGAMAFLGVQRHLLLRKFCIQQEDVWSDMLGTACRFLETAASQPCPAPLDPGQAFITSRENFEGCP